MAKAKDIILGVMNEVQGLAKRDKNQAQGFNFRGIDAVMNVVGPALRKQGGFIVPIVEDLEASTVQSARGGSLNVVRVRVIYEVWGTEGDPITGSVAAEAFDSGDKATAKAMSVAYRTFLLQLLCLPTDEPDPDSFSYEVTQRDWASEIDALKTKKEARKFYMLAQKQGADADVLAEIKVKAEDLVEE